MDIFALLLSIILLINFGSAYNVLGIFPIPYMSHYIGAETLLKGLAADGHQVTAISPFPQRKNISNFIDHTLYGIDVTLNGKNF